MQWIEVAPNGVDFVVAGTEERFFSNGLNYSILSSKGLVEEVWNTDFEEFIEGFSYIRSLGGNVVRLYFSIGPAIGRWEYVPRIVQAPVPASTRFAFESGPAGKMTVHSAACVCVEQKPSLVAPTTFTQFWSATSPVGKSTP